MHIGLTAKDDAAGEWLALTSEMYIAIADKEVDIFVRYHN